MRRAFLAMLVAGLAAAVGAEPAPTSAALQAALDLSPGARLPVWVYLRDKGPDPAPAPLSVRARSRRALRGDRRLDPAQDHEIPRAYVAAIAGLAGRVRAESRWLGAVSVEADRGEVAALARLPFVARLDLVRRSRRQPEETTPLARAAGGASSTEHALDYGPSLGQVAQINVPALHDAGLSGRGVVVAVFDTGFDNLAHESLVTLDIVARRDFVNGDDDVADGLDQGDGSHGTMTLSTLGGFMQGRLIGPAYGASFVLAKTENTASETPIEEDHWAAAAEWAESLGADVISSSLIYLVFDPPHHSYTPADMNGATAVTTLAAELAAARGVVVVGSAGNAGFHPTTNTLGAPADGAHVLAVGAVSPAGERAAFSSVGPTADGRIKPDVVAQGVQVRAAGPAAADNYVVTAGTSFSCPLVAGVVALLLEAHPTYTVDQVLALLRQTAGNAAAPNNLVGWGLVDAVAAVTAAPPALER